MNGTATETPALDGALADLFPVVYQELRRMAARRLRGQSHPTLQPTALVHDLFVRLSGQPLMQFGTRAEFFAVASRAMRAVLVDRARARAAIKRGIAVTLDVDLESVAPSTDPKTVDVLALEFALARLEALDPRPARVVELRYFCGLTIDEAAEVLDVSPMTVKREWRLARAWLRRELSRPAGAMPGCAEA